MFVKKIFLFSLVALILTACTANSFAADGMVLKYKANTETSNIYKMTMNGVTTIYLGEQTQVTQIENEMFLKQQAVAFDNEAKVISYETKVASGQMKINGVDSPLPMMGQIISTQMIDNGKFINEKNAQAKQLNGAQLVFPDGPVNVGSKWSHTMEPNAQMPVPTIIEFKILGKEKYKGADCIKIGMTMTSDNSKEVKGLEMNLSAKGIIRFDHNKGILLSNHVNSNTRMKIERVIGGKQSSITTRMEMKIRMDLQV